MSLLAFLLVSFEAFANPHLEDLITIMENQVTYLAPAPPPSCAQESRDSGDFFDRFCINPYAAICLISDGRTEIGITASDLRKARDFHRQFTKDLISRKAGTEQPSKAILESVTKLQEKIYGYESTLKILGENAKKNFLSMIESLSVPEELKTVIFNHFQSMEIVSPSEWIRRFPKNSHHVNTLCRTNGSSINAANLSFYKDEGLQSFIVFCPGMFALDWSQGAVNKIIFSTLLHEIGHSIDRLLQDWPAYHERAKASIRLMQSFKGFEGLDASSWTRELSADQWKAEALANHFTDIKSKFGKGQILEATVRKSIEGNCHRSASSSHPDGGNRITLIGRNKHLRESLGCSQTQDTIDWTNPDTYSKNPRKGQWFVF